MALTITLRHAFLEMLINIMPGVQLVWGQQEWQYIVHKMTIGCRQGPGLCVIHNKGGAPEKI